MLYDITLKFEDEYIDFLNDNSSIINSVYFSLGASHGLDARYDPGTLDLGYQKIQDGLRKLDSKIKRYVTINGRFISPTKFTTRYLESLSKALVFLAQQGLLDGLIFLDFQFIKALCLYDERVGALLELVPSINCYIDDIAKLNQYIYWIEEIKPGNPVPSKIILDRGLNRDLKKLKIISDYIRKTYPESKIEILANEGCLLHCPFKIGHDIGISMEAIQDDEWKNYEIQMQLKNMDIQKGAIGEQCISSYEKNPKELIKGPFIRPEDQVYYEELADIVKISGKMLMTTDLMKVLSQYKRRESSGNLLDILDAPMILAYNMYINSDQMPRDFAQVVGNCDKNCRACNYCEKVLDSIIQYDTTEDEE